VIGKELLHGRSRTAEVFGIEVVVEEHHAARTQLRPQGTCGIQDAAVEIAVDERQRERALERRQRLFEVALHRPDFALEVPLADLCLDVLERSRCEGVVALARASGLALEAQLVQVEPLIGVAGVDKALVARATQELAHDHCAAAAPAAAFNDIARGPGEGGDGTQQVSDPALVEDRLVLAEIRRPGRLVHACSIERRARRKAGTMA